MLFQHLLEDKCNFYLSMQALQAGIHAGMQALRVWAVPIHAGCAHSCGVCPFMRGVPIHAVCPFMQALQAGIHAGMQALRVWAVPIHAVCLHMEIGLHVIGPAYGH
jgi:hypothetical protein